MAQTATFTQLTGFQANALSRNGQMVVGLDIATSTAAFWQNGSVTDLPASSLSEAISCNADGSFIVGDDDDTELPVYWQKGTSGYTQGNLTLPAGAAIGHVLLVSSDGSVIAGYCSGPGHFQAYCVWIGRVPYTIPNVSSPILNSISDDGSTIVCDLTGNFGSTFQTPSTAMQNPA